ncbi:hypothetical protein F4802DRAFT_602967 [Xylaria palmicola]|nr:hypothetical protein F4802DRAFT_602967 [Xylaria palmicola]
MNPFGQFNASVATFRPEATNALVHVNFDFSVFTKKVVDPPSEYAGVGQHLAMTRRQEAQHGTRHGIARRLGALFKDSVLLPSTPELIKSYGRRASEISRTATANPQGNESHGAFVNMIGADATTLWAAATSGWPAIQCHLLACMLARIWEPPEATSIWVEIIAQRKHILESKLSEEGELEHDVLLAAGNDISRSDLFDWDASARAWLRVADQVMKKQQTQARLIIDNLDLPVNSKPNTYDSVINAWASSMTQMEKLLCGIPLQVHRGDILLALLSWHLYPDMKCLFAEERDVQQNDPLLRGRGVLTVGLEPSPRVMHDRQAVYWALPLAHLRYYGRLPVTRVQSMRTTQRDRLTVDELLWAMVSSYMMPWHDASIPTHTVLEFVSNVAIELHYALGYDTNTASSNERNVWLSGRVQPSNPSWLTILSRVCLQYKDRLHDERIRKLQALGRRFHQATDAPFNNIFNVETYLKAGRSIEDKIKLLREIVSSKSSSVKTTEPGYYEFIIAYKSSYSIIVDGKVTRTLDVFEYATALPQLDRHDSANRVHRRWVVPKQANSHSPDDMKIIDYRRREIRNMNETIDPFDPDKPVFIRRKGKKSPCYANGHSDYTVIVGVSSRTRRSKGVNSEVLEMLSHAGSKPVRIGEYTEVLGRLDNVALLCRRDLPPILHQSGKTDEIGHDRWPSKEVTIQQLLKLFQPGSVDFTKCAAGMHIASDINLRAMTLIESLYRDMGEATIDVRAVGVNFAKAKWVGAAIKQANEKLSGENTISVGGEDRPLPYLHAADVDTATCFACIAMMETGSYDLDPAGLRSVFGLCVSDSLYVASCLLHDPADRLNNPPIKRYIGNIGRAGMAFMVPPNDPDIRPYNLIDDWYQYNHNVFTGVMEDCFKGTSLHLSFSEASQAVNVNFSGGPDIEAYFLETLISVSYRKQWIAELDILGSMTNPNLQNKGLRQTKKCNCKGHPADRSPTIVSIDNFAEMLVPPQQPGIIRAKGNWQARLAATALCIAKGYVVWIKDRDTCLSCVLDMAEAKRAIPNRSGENKDVLMII